MASYLQEWFNRKIKTIIHYCNISHNIITSITEHMYLADTKLKCYAKARQVNILPCTLSIFEVPRGGCCSRIQQDMKYKEQRCSF